ncbi:hypothetical protein HDU86_006312 [Geranomyces michiganensis]|nr:hypothetical protein HDU86_006312 [Geranomyces michiganensis]
MHTFTPLLCLSALAAGTLAAPAPSGHTLSLPKAFARPATFTGLGAVGVAPATFAPVANDREAALIYISSKIGVSISNLEVSDDYVSSSGVRYIYVKRRADEKSGKHIANQFANVAVRDRRVLSFGTNIAGKPVASASFDGDKPLITAAAAQAAAEKALGLIRNKVAPFQRFVETAENVLEPVWAMQLTSPPNAARAEWLEVDVSAITGTIVNAVSWTRRATYKVVDFKMGGDSTPVGHIVTVKDPWSTKNSPKGWHWSNSTTTKDTSGNNVKVVDKRTGKPLTSKRNNVYDWTYDFNSTATPTNVNAVIVENFYVANLVHDLGVAYGFDERSGNFQNINFSGAGKGGDAVNIIVGTEPFEASFSTPPDGQAPVLRTGTISPDVLIHEMGHGISQRLTGGPSNVGCLEDIQAAGTAEGWSDLLYMVTSRTKAHTRNDDVIIGALFLDPSSGIRSQPYSTSLTRNTHKYSDLKTTTEVHDIGEVWATLWFEVAWNLIDKFGFDENIWTPKRDAKGNPTPGNQVALQLMFDSLAFQPCMPTFISARDAVLQADSARYNGLHKCEIWRGFAKRGLGFAAKQKPFTDDFTVPPECALVMPSVDHA